MRCLCLLLILAACGGVTPDASEWWYNQQWEMPARDDQKED